MTAEFAVSWVIDHKPAFNWWVKHVPQKRDRMIANFRIQKTRHLKKYDKFSIEVNKTVKKALNLDAKNGNILWANAFLKKLEHVRVALEILPDGKKSTHRRQVCVMPYGVQY